MCAEWTDRPHSYPEPAFNFQADIAAEQRVLDLFASSAPGSALYIPSSSMVADAFHLKGHSPLHPTYSILGHDIGEPDTDC